MFIVVHFPSQIMKINVKRKIILLSVFYGCEIWFLVLMVECKLQGTQNRVL